MRTGGQNVSTASSDSAPRRPCNVSQPGTVENGVAALARTCSRHVQTHTYMWSMRARPAQVS